MYITKKIYFFHEYYNLIEKLFEMLCMDSSVCILRKLQYLCCPFTEMSLQDTDYSISVVYGHLHPEKVKGQIVYGLKRSCDMQNEVGPVRNRLKFLCSV